MTGEAETLGEGVMGRKPSKTALEKKLTIVGSRTSFKVRDSAAVEENEEPKNRWQIVLRK